MWTAKWSIGCMNLGLHAHKGCLYVIEMKSSLYAINWFYNTPLFLQKICLYQKAQYIELHQCSSGIMPSTNAWNILIMSVNYLKRQKFLCFGKLKYMAPPCSINLDFIHNRCPAEWRFSVRKKWYIVVTGHVVVMNWSPMNGNVQFCLAMFLLVFHSFKSMWCTVFFRITKILHILFNTNIIFLSMLHSFFMLLSFLRVGFYI